MNDLEFYFDDENYMMVQPFESVSSVSLFDTNVADTFSAAGATPVCLPPGLVYVGDRQSLVIFERPPCYKTISYNKKKRDEALHYKSNNIEVTVPIPWQIYVGEFGPNGILNALHLYFASSEIYSLTIGSLAPYSDITVHLRDNGRLFKAPLPNIYETNLICLDKETYHPENSNLASKINLMYSSVWDTVFNSDITFSVDAQIDHLSHTGHSINKYGGVGAIEAWFKYWKKINITKLMDNLTIADNKKGYPIAPLFFYQNSYNIKLSEFFIQPTTYKFFNSLQQIL